MLSYYTIDYIPCAGLYISMTVCITTYLYLISSPFQHPQHENIFKPETISKPYLCLQLILEAHCYNVAFFLNAASLNWWKTAWPESAHHGCFSRKQLPSLQALYPQLDKTFPVQQLSFRYNPGVPNLWPPHTSTGPGLGRIVEVSLNVMRLNHPETIPLPSPSMVCGKIIFHKTGSWCQKGWGLRIFLHRGMMSVDWFYPFLPGEMLCVATLKIQPVIPVR